MHSSEVVSLKNKLIKCYKYRDYETAAYISMHISESFPEFQLLTGIIFYENQEYSRSLFHLSNLEGTTAVFYKALSYMKVKKYSEAVVELTTIIESKTAPEKVTDIFLSSFILDPVDTEFFEALFGKLLILKGKAKQGVEKYRKSMFKNPLLGPCLGLFDENNWIAPINQFATDPIMMLFQDLFKLSVQRTSEAEQTSEDKPSIPQTAGDLLLCFLKQNSTSQAHQA
ncbi:uncharacterized protein VICG_00199 [Vittaforma corneae ATCC 50505]|uniref:Suppressor of forked domain-containing protein n=1 Tax=Vittaforma corneae (strain ATCC 50505) TaxID=993615 RepID=L2GQH8_VITCO|nr:uncharacterized protein VICG_00199 [Vittaforma corneae ATCC 50505]ELA42884.1 hypothetical protein VICG_00199 [Vittaforma corneae ATCC 50505]